MKSLLQFFLLIALVVIGKQVKEQTRPQTASKAAVPVRQQADSIHTFFVENVNYKPLSSRSAESQRQTQKASTYSFN